MKIIELVSKDAITKINNLVKKYDKNNEFEVSIMSNRETSENLLTLERFNNLNSVLSIITKKNDSKYAKIVESTLDTILSTSESTADKMINYRISINGLEKINEYMGMLHMRKNHLVFSVLTRFLQDESIKKNNIELIKKTKNLSEYILLQDIYMKIKMDDEELLSGEEIKKVLDINKNFKNENYSIFYRFKERNSYFIVKEKNIFRIDLTMVRSSNEINNIQKSPYKYEIEIECMIKDKSTVVEQLFEISEFIIKSIQKSNYITTKSISDEVLLKYKKILDISTESTSLYGRQPISLEVQHLVDNLPNKYAVTDKADGDRNFMLVYNSRCYLISTNLVVMDTGLDINKKYNNSIIDGEFIFVSKQNRYLYMAFDCLVIGETNVCDESKLIKRLEYLNEIIEAINDVKFKPKNPIDAKIDLNNMPELLKFHQDNIKKMYEDINKELMVKNNKILFRKKYFMECNGIYDNEIFKYSNSILNIYVNNPLINIPYHLDGTIYQPLDQKYIQNPSKSKYSDYKWKPPDQNSIDFYIEFEKDKNTGKIYKVYDNSQSEMLKNKPYYICNLYVGDTSKGIEKPVLFGLQEGVYQCYIYLDDNDVPRTIDGKPMMDKTVVEFYYNLTSDASPQNKWVAMRTRFDKTEAVQKHSKRYGNNSFTAKKIWRSITNPILVSDFVALSDDKQFDKYFNLMKNKIDFSAVKSEIQESAYYQKKSDLIKDMGSFHNWIKSNILYTYNNRYYNNNTQYKILDVGVGRAGDMQKYYYTEVDLLVGIDPDSETLLNSADGAVSRYNHAKKTHANYPPMYFITANPGNLLQYDEQVKIIGRMTNDNKKMFDKFFKWDDQRTMFDRVVSMFAIHYLLENDTTWNNFTENINKYMREGAYLIFTTFDGDVVNEKLKGVDKITEYYEENGEKKILYEIVKKYDENDKNKIGQAIDVHMSWIFNEGVYKPEYLVYYDFIVKSLKEKCDLVLVESESFEEVFNNNKEFLNLGSDIEQDAKGKKFYTSVNKFMIPTDINKKCYTYSFMNRFYVFRKKESNLIDVKKKYYMNKFVGKSKSGKQTKYVKR